MVEEPWLGHYIILWYDSGEKNILEKDYLETRVYEINMEQLESIMTEEQKSSCFRW
jgi:hypothetical protein